MDLEDADCLIRLICSRVQFNITAQSLQFQPQREEYYCVNIETSSTQFIMDLLTAAVWEIRSNCRHSSTFLTCQKSN